VTTTQKTVKALPTIFGEINKKEASTILTPPTGIGKTVQIIRRHPIRSPKCNEESDEAKSILKVG